MNISFRSSDPFGSMPPSTEGFKEGLKDKSTEDLVNMLNKGGLNEAQMKAVGQELASRLKSEGSEETGGSGGGGEEDELQKLLKKLQDGTITPEELKKLTGLLKEAENKGEEKPEDIQGG
ncbi:hypothetical protein [Pseudoduganella violacea]|uniref:Polyhydroxyalkanoate synthesis regulator phasin n=1 Tax=Pseudoduganella violacea TaxID=1715466 RepID=A0A7W5BF31_9BURK|nr:hypothetical protein [Pseudoduganella violacea]MBB3121963.1 polyhydroxyalkanoate synthesis regulator phasin [Pseudoduganella violacea]